MIKYKIDDNVRLINPITPIRSLGGLCWKAEFNTYLNRKATIIDICFSFNYDKYYMLQFDDGYIIGVYGDSIIDINTERLNKLERLL